MVSLSLSCSLRARFAVSIHLLSPHILPQLPDGLIKTALSSFSLGVGGSRKPPWGCLPGAVTSVLCWEQPAARVGWGLVMDVCLDVHLKALGAGTLPAWPSSAQGQLVVAQGRVTGCDTVLLLASAAPQPLHHQWEGGAVVRAGHCTPD